MPDNAMAREARSLHASPERVLVHPWIGEVGFYAGPAKDIIDPQTGRRSDPCSRRGYPSLRRFTSSSGSATSPASCPPAISNPGAPGGNVIEDPIIHEYFDKLLRVTTGPVFSFARFKDIWYLNWNQRDLQGTRQGPSAAERRRPHHESAVLDPRGLARRGEQADQAPPARPATF